MRKPVYGLILLVLLLAAIGSIRFIKRTRHVPRPLGWRAHVSTVAGDGSPAFRDGQAAQSAFADPFGMAIGSDGTIYISDAGNSNRIRKIAPDGVVTTLAGGSEGFSDGVGSQASFNTPSGLAIDSVGNLYVADTSNNRIRRISREGLVSTIAGDGNSGYVDGPAANARFNGPVGVAVDQQGAVYVADTYNDRIRKISIDGQVTTVAGAGRPGYVDGDAANAMFDTPCGLVVSTDGSLIVADTNNSRLRKISAGQVSTIQVSFTSDFNLGRPVALSLTPDGFIYVASLDRNRVVQVAPDGTARAIEWGDENYLTQVSGIALNSHGDLYVTDSGNYLVRKLSQAPSESQTTSSDHIPQITNAMLGEELLLWPLDPQRTPHEVVATMGEVRGSFNSTDSRDHLHSGLDVFASYGDIVRVIHSEKITSPLANWGFDSLSEGLRVGVFSYIHLQVGRDKDGNILDQNRFIQVLGDDGKLSRVRIRRGTRFQVGDALGNVNRMYHVHLIVGPPGEEQNPLSLSPVGFSDHIAPTIEKDGIQLLDSSGARLSEKRDGRVVVHGKLRIVVDAYDRTDMNAERRRLGVYRVGYQILKGDGTPAHGFEQPRINIVFNRLPADDSAVKLAYADQSGITVYGSATTRFLYEVTNTVKDGHAAAGVWDSSEMPAGNYVLRVIVADYSGNEATEGRDLPITVNP